MLEHERSTNADTRKIRIILVFLIISSTILPIIAEYFLYPKTPLTIYGLFLVPIIYISFHYDMRVIAIGLISINSIHFIWGIIVLPMIYEVNVYVRTLNHIGLTLISFALAILIGCLLRKINVQQAQLNESEKLYRSVVETSPNPILIHKYGEIVYVNPAAVRIAGFDTDKKFLNQLILDFMHPTSEEMYHTRLQDFIEESLDEKTVEYQMVRPDGTRVYVETLGKKIIYKGENAILAVGTDVTERKEKEEELRKREALLEKSQRMAHIGSWELNLIEDKFYWSKETYRIFGISEEFVQNYESFLNFVPRDEREFVNRKNEEALRGEPYSIRHRIIRLDGEERHVYAQAEVTFNDQGQPILMVGTVQDITENTIIEQKLKESEEKFRSLVQYSYDMIAIIDGKGIIKYLSPSVERNLGTNITNNIGRSVIEFIHANDIEYSMKKTNKVLNHPNEAIKSELRIKDEDGKSIYIEMVSTNLINNPSINGIVINFRDITAQKKSYDTIQHMAFHDDVTNLLNKRGLNQLLVDEIDKNDSFSLLFLDLDNFKHVNDSFGHDAGDKLLEKIATRLSELVNGQGEVARMGGDEFAILLWNTTNKTNPNDVAEGIIELFNQPLTIFNYHCYITASVGIVTYPNNGLDKDSLLKHADMAMYEAKQAGKNTFRTYHSTMEKMNERTFRLQNDLRTAIDHNEFMLYYQPWIRADDCATLGAEALIRWNHPKLGLISPAEFISIAENSGVIVPLGEWVLETACKQLRIWNQQGHIDFKLSINFSTVQFMRKDLHEKVKQIIEKHRVNPKNIEIEITESAVMEQDISLQENIRNLKKLGIRIAIDDFGTGYSSMIYIKKFQADTIKIDRSFIANLQEDSDDAEIVLAIINLAKALKLNVVAEGVETKEQYNMLKEMDCVEMQGYYFAKPLPSEEIEKQL
ncbi:EAL domain-containing protein [Aquibacillus halophilus]|uniref:EAL domain-containing protein n=1 Tax=Aquibacillus halophilus TaxID=930132 RepID=A0A6A8D7P4_9BACI|nr:bifunctional diguanylate cyclase/phosphodiesterase [Aquibacillus halophilus]MRH41614.1 EAL domain-containing protein [Aquibacillus halophilus]